MKIKVMTDLSQEYHPQPKPLAKVKMPKSMKKEGKKTISWADERKKLVIKFNEMNIRSCEIRFENCWKNTALGFAHLEKRRKLGPDDLGEVVLACNICHEVVERWPAEKMKDYLKLIIWKRRIKK